MEIMKRLQTVSDAVRKVRLFVIRNSYEENACGICLGCKGMWITLK